jgi:hypothetical protein
VINYKVLTNNYYHHHSSLYLLSILLYCTIQRSVMIPSKTWYYRRSDKAPWQFIIIIIILYICYGQGYEFGHSMNGSCRFMNFFCIQTSVRRVFFFLNYHNSVNSTIVLRIEYLLIDGFCTDCPAIRVVD